MRQKVELQAWPAVRNQKAPGNASWSPERLEQGLLGSRCVNPTPLCFTIWRRLLATTEHLLGSKTSRAPLGLSLRLLG